MKKIILFVVCLVCLTGQALAQRPVVYLAPLTYDMREVRSIAPAFRAAVLNGIVRADRVKIINGDIAQTQYESVLQAARAAGADFVFECKLLGNSLNNVQSLIFLMDDALQARSSYIFENMSYHVELTRVSDGIMIHSKQYDNSTSISTSTYTSVNRMFAASQALTRATDNALLWVSQQVMTYFEGEFPLEARIVEVAELKRDKLKKVYINLGRSSPVHKNLYFDVFTHGMVAGQNTKQCIGQVRVDELRGDSISLCTVNRGASEVKAAIDKDSKLTLISVVR